MSEAQSRMLVLFPQHRAQQQHVCLIGCGAIGSYAGITLAKMGIINFTIYDNDTVEEVNRGVQLYDRTHMGEYKTNALREQLLLHGNPGTTVRTNVSRFSSYHVLPEQTTICIVAVDNIRSRKLIFDKWERHHERPKRLGYIKRRGFYNWRTMQREGEQVEVERRPVLWIDPRMGAEEFEIHATGGGTDIRRMRGWVLNGYKTTLNINTQPAACGMESTPYTAEACAAQIAILVRKWTMPEVPIYGYQYWDLFNGVYHKSALLDGNFKRKAKRK